MTNKPKNIGTATETAVVKFARANGFPNAERRALAGANDVGDILLATGVIAEVKGGVAAETASDLQIGKWLLETRHEVSNANADLGFLITKRKGFGAKNAGKWWVHFVLEWVPSDKQWLGKLLSDQPINVRIICRTTLDQFVSGLAAHGYGD